ncbi:unnamed protein product [Rotaria sp. Silwood2]|nr:unnamed protein product [Rotaria sp. Silwood2]CAF2544135.1 unnamed protein product [Rotaria sp. Silwood2]CAF2795610.1 unnamed protein product [Rotaria sp. Silwood2]CAF2924637.1 unnamed protein product [Rotaria sp. Silwood2]CAF3876800.1 unnamed protein product [Rotaria sp. Silwood2]
MNNKNEIMVFGHRNSDTDSIITALVFADFLRRIKINAKAYRLSDLDNETKFVLKTVGIEQPDMLPNNLPDGTEVALMDHNESQHSMENLKKMRVTYVIDHHKLGDLTTSEPVFLRFEPVGSAATILTKLHIEHQLDIDQKTALLLISAIISDTLHFRLPTTTDEDRSIVDYLLPIAKINNIESYANQMFEANSDLSGLSMQQILLHGYKTFLFNDQYWGISVLYTFYPNDVLERKEDVLKEMLNQKEKNHLTGILFSVIDIIKEQNFMVILGEPENTVVRKAFNVDFEGQVANLGSRISRKKDIVPPLEAYFKTKP